MEKIYALLKYNRLESFYNKFLELGVKDENDFIDGIDDETLKEMGLSQVEKKRFEIMLKRIDPKLVQNFSVKYTFPKCSELREINDMDPSQNTLEDLMLRIAIQENIGTDNAVCLYTVDGMPLTDDSFFNTWCFNDRHIENGDEIYAIFTPKENIQTPVKSNPQSRQVPGADTVRCHIMLKGDYEIKVNLDTDNLQDLRKELSNETGIPAHVLRAKDEEEGGGTPLEDLGISCQSILHFSLSSLNDKYQDKAAFFNSDISASIPQTTKGMSVFLSALYAIHMRHSDGQFLMVIAYIRKLTGCNALALALYQMMCKGEFGTRNQKVAVVEGLYLLFRELLPSLTKRNGLRVIEDHEVFEYSTICWAYLMSQAKENGQHSEVYATMRLTCEGSGSNLCEPVRIPGIASVYERAFILDKIRDEQRIPNCTEDNLKETSLQRARNIEKILLSLPRQTRYFHQWIIYDCGHGHNFQVKPEKTYEEMTDGLSVYSHLELTPPLQLKNLGMEGPRLILLDEDNCAVYLSQNKGQQSLVQVFDCLAGKEKAVDVDELANRLKDARTDQTYKIGGVPEEAIMVLVDASSSMADVCYEQDQTRSRMDVVKQLFLAFMARTSAYSFHHIIGLVKFGGCCLDFHEFTETVGVFQRYVNSLEACGCTPLYDALNLGISKLSDVKKKFPDCRLRMLCLSDGNDEGSSRDPVKVAVRLIDAHIVVDTVILGGEENGVLHGISNVTGGCCFKPETGKEALKLFEMETVLSLKGRKLKKKHVASSIKGLADLCGILQGKGYDKEPEVLLPKEVNDKVTLPLIALNNAPKQTTEMSRERQILDELRSLHVDPHPYCTVFPSETDFSFWKILMSGPPDTPYEKGNFELYCQFGADYPLKPPQVRFLTPIHHCNVNSIGRICHNIFDGNYSANVTMKEILDSVFGLLIAAEPDDPLDSVVAEEFLSNPQAYVKQAEKTTVEAAGTSLEDMEKKLVAESLNKVQIPRHLICQLSGKMFIDPVSTKYGDVYERKCIEKELIKKQEDPFNKKPLKKTDLTPNRKMKAMVKEYRSHEISQPLSN
ncbi:uncharacterized protein LOC133129607 isoform X1 [Conger conger]|uniref:uncharacterized protein LOC133129607 isoform X1 n=1 Tax=Conger conger TaxID=82655 RepID=UPI002A5AF4E0|nr:uncharacterized protein LOC133129607 isoform X1 [Conger conger]